MSDSEWKVVYAVLTWPLVLAMLPVAIISKGLLRLGFRVAVTAAAIALGALLQVLAFTLASYGNTDLPYAAATLVLAAVLALADATNLRSSRPTAGATIALGVVLLLALPQLHDGPFTRHPDSARNTLATFGPFLTVAVYSLYVELKLYRRR